MFRTTRGRDENVLLPGGRTIRLGVAWELVLIGALAATRLATIVRRHVQVPK